MSKQIEAIYENGVLRPLEPLNLNEHQRVTITIAEESGEEEDLFDPAFTRWCAEQSRNAPSLEDVRQALSKIQGSMADIVITERDERQMARSFLDTSALVKYYHPEEGTGAVTQFVQERNGQHYISRLGIVEAQHASLNLSDFVVD